MHFRTVGSVLAFAVLFFVATELRAQTGFEGPGACTRTSRLTSNIPCTEGSREGETVVFEHELTVTTRLEGVTVQTKRCQAEVELSYVQKNTLASVEGIINNNTCAASSGTLVLSVRTASESGELTTQEFGEPWSRDDDQSVSFSFEYPIGENSDLLRVRALRTGCTCAELPAEAAE